MAEEYNRSQVVVTDRYVAGSAVDGTQGGSVASAHSGNHEDGGVDEISVEGLSGLLADPQTALPHVHPYTKEVSLFGFVADPTRNSAIHMHGFLHKALDAGAVSSGSPQNVNGALSRMMIVVNAGPDLTGTLTITGTSVNPSTGAETGSDTENIAISGASTDTSDTDAQGNVRHGFSGAYITQKWWKGTVTVSTADTDVSDFDVWLVSFEQFNQSADITVTTFDLTVTNVAAAPPAEWFYAYLYSVIVTAGAVAVARIATIGLDPTPNPGTYRLRRNSINVALDGTKDGVFAAMFFGPTVVNEWENLNVKIWADVGAQTGSGP